MPSPISLFCCSKPRTDDNRHDQTQSSGGDRARGHHRERSITQHRGDSNRTSEASEQTLRASAANHGDKQLSRRSAQEASNMPSTLQADTVTPATAPPPPYEPQAADYQQQLNNLLSAVYSYSDGVPDRLSIELIRALEEQLGNIPELCIQPGVMNLHNIDRAEAAKKISALHVKFCEHQLKIHQQEYQKITQDINKTILSISNLIQRLDVFSKSIDRSIENRTKQTIITNLSQLQSNAKSLLASLQTKEKMDKFSYTMEELKIELTTERLKTAKRELDTLTLEVSTLPKGEVRTALMQQQKNYKESLSTFAIQLQSQQLTGQLSDAEKLLNSLSANPSANLSESQINRVKTLLANAEEKLSGIDSPEHQNRLTALHSKYNELVARSEKQKTEILKQQQSQQHQTLITGTNEALDRIDRIITTHESSGLPLATSFTTELGLLFSKSTVNTTNIPKTHEQHQFILSKLGSLRGRLDQLTAESVNKNQSASPATSTINVVVNAAPRTPTIIPGGGNQADVFYRIIDEFGSKALFQEFMLRNELITPNVIDELSYERKYSREIQYDMLIKAYQRTGRNFYNIINEAFKTFTTGPYLQIT